MNVKCELSENRDLNTFPQMQAANTPVSTGFTSDEIQQRESKWKFQIDNLLQKTPNNPPMMKPVKNENVSTLLPNDLSTREAKWNSMIQSMPSNPLFFASFQSWDHLPFVPVTMNIFHGVHGEIYSLTGHALFDTGAQVSCISDDFLPEFLRHEVLLKVDIIIEGYEAISTIVSVRPRLQMPNQSSIFIIGQYGLIENLCFDYHGSITAVPNNGQLLARSLFDPDTQVTKNL